MNEHNNVYMCPTCLGEEFAPGKCKYDGTELVVKDAENKLKVWWKGSHTLHDLEVLLAQEKQRSYEEGVKEERERIKNLVKTIKNPFNSGTSDIANAANNGFWQAIFNITRFLESHSATAQEEGM